ncbi:MAG: hypothetical protein ACOC93_00035 [Planctomycetota bacterium]
MSMTQRQRIRIAHAIRRQLRCQQRQRWRMLRGRLSAACEQLQQLETLRRRLAICESRDWQATGRRLAGDLRAVLRRAPYSLQDVQQAMYSCGGEIPPAAEIYRDLLQLEQEFGLLRYDADDHVLVATTDAIELREVYLGPFEIQLRLDGLAEWMHGRIFRIVATDPHPAASDDRVTHPHVSNQQLCPGDAGAAIETALSEGRICDFFLLVRSILTHYNPDSPFVPLDNWSGMACYDCGYVTAPEEMLWCSACERDFCQDCATCCPCCDEVACLGCLQRCEACEEPVCDSCLASCPACGRPICDACLQESLCPCHSDRKDPDHDQDQATSDHDPRREGTDAA